MRVCESAYVRECVCVFVCVIESMQVCAHVRVDLCDDEDDGESTKLEWTK